MLGGLVLLVAVALAAVGGLAVRASRATSRRG
jgi:hypothetical protein